MRSHHPATELTVACAVFGTPRGVIEARDAVMAAIETWPSPVQGVCPTFHYHPRRPELSGHTLVLCEAHGLGRARLIEAAGCSIDSSQAGTAAAGELVERASATCWRPADAVVATTTEMLASGERVFDVDLYLGTPLAPHQSRPADRDRLKTWVTGTSLSDGRSVYVPAALVGVSDGEASPVELTSVGVAAGPHDEAAARGAVLEIIERDLLRTAWYQRWPLGRTLDEDDRVRHIIGVDKQNGWVTSPRCYQSDDLGVYIVLTRHQDLPIYAIGSAATSSADHGIAHAWAEATQLRLRLALLSDRSISSIPRTFGDHLRYYCTPQGIDYVFGLLNAPGADTPTPGRPRSYDHAAAAACLVDLSPPGMTAVRRALIPSFQLMEADHRRARVNAVSQACATLNSDPHPYG